MSSFFLLAAYVHCVQSLVSPGILRLSMPPTISRAYFYLIRKVEARSLSPAKSTHIGGFHVEDVKYGVIATVPEFIRNERVVASKWHDGGPWITERIELSLDV